MPESAGVLHDRVVSESRSEIRMGTYVGNAGAIRAGDFDAGLTAANRAQRIHPYSEASKQATQPSR